MVYSYAAFQSKAFTAVEQKRGKPFNAKQRSIMERAHAHVLQWVERLGADRTVKAVRARAYKSVLAALGIWEIFAPILIPFLKEALRLLVEWIISQLDNIVEPAQLSILFGQAKASYAI